MNNIIIWSIIFIIILIILYFINININKVYYEIDEITYEKIFKVIGTIRTTKNIIDSLKNILIKY